MFSYSLAASSTPVTSYSPISAVPSYPTPPHRRAAQSKSYPPASAATQPSSAWQPLSLPTTSQPLPEHQYPSPMWKKSFLSDDWLKMSLAIRIPSTQTSSSNRPRGAKRNPTNAGRDKLATPLPIWYDTHIL